MANGYTTYLANKINDNTFGNTAYSVPATLYIALFTDSNTPTQRNAGTVTETTYTNYARVAVTNNTTNFPNSSAGSKTNGATFTFATCGASGATLTAFGVYDASTAGNLLAWGDLTASKTVANGDTPSFSSGQLTISQAVGS